jgi:decaprenyl-phosphate phosphoribosyltransferase
MAVGNKKVLLTDYMNLGRPDHWVKNLFMFPGLGLALAFASESQYSIDATRLLIDLVVTFFSLCLASSANYTINEWLDRSFDKFHPEKSQRPAVAKQLSAKIVWGQYFALVSLSLVTALAVTFVVLSLIIALLLMGLLYNVPPVRLKDRFYLDVLSESINNPIRVALGWYTAVTEILFPASALIAFWAAGVFLMSLKRYTEITTLGESSSLVKYRASFKSWTPNKLLKFSLTGALTSTTFLGILLAGYKLEYIFLFPSVCFLFQYYFGLALSLKSEVSAPEDLWKNKNLNLQISLLMILAIVLSFIEISLLNDLIGFTL